MSTTQITKSPRLSSIPFSILDLKAQAVRLPISKGAQILLSELLTWSGERGYCWWGKPAIANDLNWSTSEVWRRATELKLAGLLEVIPRPGRSNYWIPLPGRNRMERFQNERAPIAIPRRPFLKENEKLKRCTIPQHGICTEEPPPSPNPANVNAVKVCSEEISPLAKTTPDIPVESAHEPVPVVQAPFQPEPIRQKPFPPKSVQQETTSTTPGNPKTNFPLTQDHLFLVEEIERVTGDTWSRGHFVNLVRQTDEQTIYSALSVTKEKISLESGVNAGAYFTATVRGLTGLKNLGQPYSPPSVPLMRPPEPKRQLDQRPKPIEIPEPDPEPLDIEGMKKGWLLLYRPGNVGSVLSVIGRCLEGWDVSATWNSLLSERQGEPEEAVLHELLDLAGLKVEYAIDAGR
jgi:hypothetical protein